MRAVPDVAMTAASHDGYLINENGSWYVIAGTSAASPSFAGVMAIVDQKQGGGQGNANPGLYGMLDAAQNPFHATLSGNNTVPGVAGFTASGAAYNLATGLGSVDANVLVNNWSSSGTVTTPLAGFTLKASAVSESLLQGKSATFTVAVSATGGFTGTVSLKATTPAGVTLSFNPVSLKPGASSTATLTVASSAPAGTSNITITGTSGTTTAATTVGMTVLATPTLTIAESAAKVEIAQGSSGALQFTTTIGGAFSGTVALAVTGLPAGVSATWTNGSYSPTSDGTTTSTLTLKPSTAAALATTSLKITATGDGLTASTTASVQVTAAPAITATLAPATISMQSMATTSMTVTVNPAGGVSLASSASTAAFKVTGLPAGITGSWGAATVTSAGALQAKLTLTGGTSALSTSTKPAITVSAVDSVTGKTFSAGATATLTVTRVLPTLVVTPAASKVTLVQGQSATLQVTTTTGGSYAGLVTLGVTGLPTGVTATWTNGSYTSTAAGSTASTLTLKATTAAAVATTALKITATGDAVTGQASESLQVTHLPAITLALSLAAINIKSTASQALTVTLTPLGGVQPDMSSTGSSFQVTGLPAGFTASWGTPALTAAGAMQVTLTLTGSSTAITSTSKPAVTAQVHDSATGILYSASEQAAMTVTRPNALAIAATSSGLSIGKGTSATNQITIATGNTFHTTVSLSISGLPTGVSATWSANPVTPNASSGEAAATLTLKSATTSPVASKTVVITATGGGITVTKSVSVAVIN